MTLPEIANHHLTLEAAIFSLFSVPNHSSHAALEKYVGTSLSEARSCVLEELEHTSSLSLLASIEAALRVDFAQRVSARRRNALTKAFRQIDKDKKKYVRLEDDILEAWKEHSTVAKPVISALISAFKYRHWLAHGRYWPPKFGRRYDYHSIYEIADTFINAMAMTP